MLGLLESDCVKDRAEFRIEVVNGTIVEDIEICCGDRPAFLEVLDFTNVALANSLCVKGAVGALGDAAIAELFWRDNSYKS